MGMAASQARLLSITARIHDVEFQAQSIQHAKIQLATQSDQVYQKYLEALDDATLTLTSIDADSGVKTTLPATFNNLCSKKKLLAADGNNYALKNRDGRLIVEPDVMEAYKLFKSKDFGYENSAYMFALYMSGASEADIRTMRAVEESIFQTHKDDAGNEDLKAMHDKLLELNKSDNVYDTTNFYGTDETVEPEVIKEYEETLKAYQKALYSKYATEIFVGAANSDESATKKVTEEDFSSDKFNYYMSIYKQIEYCGGCVPITDYNGSNGDAANDSDWLHAMVECGEISIEILTEDSKTGDIKLASTSPSSDISVSETQTTDIDKTALAKAEAEYNHDLKEINQKDKQYDLNLSKLESERSALTTEYDSIKKVIDENIERTFGIFS